MTKKELLMAVSSANPRFSKRQVEDAVDLFFQLIKHYLINHQRVELRGFGVFSIRKRAAHKAHNPQTGELLYVEEKCVPFFRPSSFLREMLKETKIEKSKEKKGLFSSFVDRYRYSFKK